MAQIPGVATAQESLTTFELSLEEVKVNGALSVELSKSGSSHENDREAEGKS